MPRDSVYIALVHHPVLDKAGNVVTTAVTNLDVHDFSRLARSYALAGFFLVTPIAAQQELAEHLLAHWRRGPGKTRVPERADALRLCTVVNSVAEAQAELASQYQLAPRVIATGARPRQTDKGCSYREAAQAIEQGNRPTLILYGTGHGLAEPLFETADSILEPLRGTSDYNHLSVRTAAAISLDRLFGEG